MALFQEAHLRNIATRRVNNDSRYSYEGNTRDSIEKSLLLESYQVFNAGKNDFDIFLSHSFSDKNLILGLKIKLESYRYSVYVDWIDDFSMDRTNVTASNVKWIKQRMRASKCLLYATSSNSSNSKWMPWETGFMDAFTGKVAIIPIVTSFQYTYAGNEYLGSYPYVEEEVIQNSSKSTLWVTDQADRLLYTRFDLWLKGGYLTHHTS
jgi:hypothetical protein